MKSRASVMALCLALAALFAGTRADEPKGVRVERATAEPTTTHRLPLDTLSESAPAQPSERHPLMPAMDMAVKAYQYAQDHVHDFTCVLIKRERIDGKLLDPQFVQTRVRAHWADAGRPPQPYSVFLDFLSPPSVRRRTMFFIEGRNDNKMLEHNGGKLLNYVTFKLDPESEAAMRQTLVPITRMGFANVTELLISLIQQDMRRDPSALNTEVKFYRNAKVNDRVCTRIMVTHPQPDPILGFAEANVFVDDELHVPIRIEAATWPKQLGESKPLLFEYTFTQLQINVGLTDADFQVSLLDGNR